MECNETEIRPLTDAELDATVGGLLGALAIMAGYTASEMVGENVAQAYYQPENFLHFDYLA